MNTVIDLPELRPRIVDDPSEIDRLRWFQMNRYFESGIVNTRPTGLPDDPLVEHSTYFGVYSGDKIHATARVTKAPDGRLPIMKHHPLFPAAERRIRNERRSVAELSRVAVCRDSPHYTAFTLLSREFLRFGLRNQEASLLVASVEKPMVRILRLFGVPTHIIGPTLDKYGDLNGVTVPIMIDTVECLENFRRRESRRWEFFVEGLVIDLTDSRMPFAACDHLEHVAS